jgi:hypothetical protein
LRPILPLLQGILVMKVVSVGSGTVNCLMQVQIEGTDFDPAKLPDVWTVRLLSNT